MNRDSNGFILDQTGDGGDSANRAGLFALVTGLPEPLEAYEKSSGLLVRHPTQHPWNNPKNFSRDQLIPFVAGAWRLGNHKLVRRVFWAHFRRGFFCQNIERDATGTQKYPWPHRFINDRGLPEFRAFDFADILAPNDIWHLILCGKIWYFYWFAPVGYLFLALSILIHGKFNSSDDEGQIISQAIVAGPWFLKLYKLVKPDYVGSLTRYWVDARGMTLMSEKVVARLTV